MKINIPVCPTCEAPKPDPALPCKVCAMLASITVQMEKKRNYYKDKYAKKENIRTSGPEL